jgi:hypothetical protein
LNLKPVSRLPSDPGVFGVKIIVFPVKNQAERPGFFGNFELNNAVLFPRFKACR